MGLTLTPWRYLAAGLVVLLALLVPYALWVRGELRSAALELQQVQATVQGLQRDAEARVRVDIKQSTQRAAAASGVRAVRAAVDKEVHGNAGTPVDFGPDELARLQRVVDAGNSAIRAAAELP